MKINGTGQAAILDRKIYERLNRGFRSKKYRLLFNIALYTGERWGAVCQLKLGDVYLDPARRIVREKITFAAATRKGDRLGRRETRQVKVNPELRAMLEAYSPSTAPSDGSWLFPSRSNRGEPITLRCADLYLRKALEHAGLSYSGISTHSTRRTFITRLHESGVSIAEIKKITGHKSTKALLRYIEVSPQRVDQIVENFSL